MSNDESHYPLIAILRGITPDEVVAIGEAVIDAGIRTIEIPMNSPDVYDSIAMLLDATGKDATIGGGTVLSIAQVEILGAMGANLIVSPDTNPEVIERTRELGMYSMPGAQTATECFQAIWAGANGLKLFPASMIGTGGLKALKAVLPVDFPLYAVGGVGHEDFGEWLSAGITGFGIGTALYKPGDDGKIVHQRACEIVLSYEEWRSTCTN